ncbi:MAG: MFS transporter [Spirochaetales bacterium]|nr:MFS transporter [Spirochaetales bacterium]
MKKLLAGMTHNGRVITFTEPFWAIPFNLFTVYAVLYMMDLGLTEREIGLIQTVLIITQIVSSIFSGKLTDYLGSKKTTIIFDSISWAGACIVWAFSSSFLGFAIAAFLNGINKIVFVSFTHLISYNTKPSERLSNYTGMHIMVILGGFFAPLGGYIVNKLGLIPGMRGIYLFSGITMLTMFLIRNAMFKEPESHPEREHFSIVKGVKDSLKYFFSTSKLKRVFTLQAIAQFYGAFKPIFYFAFLRDSAGLTSFQLSIVPVVMSIITFLIMVLYVPKVIDEPKALTLGFFAGAISLCLLTLSATSSIIFILPAIALDALSTAIINPVISSFWITNLDEKRSTTQLGTGFFLFSLISVPAGILAAELYNKMPVLPFFAASGFLLLSGVISYTLRARK